MLTKEYLLQIIHDQSEYKTENKIINRLESDFSINKNVLILSGIRRCGKSTILKLLKKKYEPSLFVNFEDPRLEGFDLSDFNRLETIALEQKCKLFLFDEIQNIIGWEKYIRTANDRGFKIIITGSNAHLLSRELGTKLTGRYIQQEIFPFSYKEFLKFKKLIASNKTFLQYLEKGGFPDYLSFMQKEYLQNLLRDIVIRDIAVRRNIKNEHLLIQLAVTLISNCGKEFSYNKLTNNLGIKSVRTTIDYCDYLKESYLFDFIPRFSYSTTKQINNPKKVYCIDNGMIKANSISLNEDLGRLLENIIFIYLRKQSDDISYYNDQKNECDFIAILKNQKRLAIQVCAHLNENNLKREIEGLKKAKEFTKANNAFIISLNQEDIFDGIKVIPAWKWMEL